MYLKTLAMIVIFWLSSLNALVTLEKRDNQRLLLTTLYGSTAIEEPVLIDLINHPAFERLKNIHQYGAVRYVPNQKSFTRYEHSLGVFFLTRLYGAPLEEQIAGLLHDVSHTAFSHVGDRFFKSDYLVNNESYQDMIHEWYLKETGVMNILQQYGYEAACSKEAKMRQRCFEQSLPNICADRLEYNLSGGFLDELITGDEITALLKTLHFSDDQWFFTDVNMARKFGLMSLQLCESRWGAAWSVCVDNTTAQALHRAVDLHIISLDDIHFSDDETIWKILAHSNDEAINRLMNIIVTIPLSFSCDNTQSSDGYLRGKFSGIDPLVMHKGCLVHLSEVDDYYRELFERVGSLVHRGWCITITV